MATPEGDRAAARRLGYAGVTSYQAARYDVATEQLERAYAVLRVPSIGLWSARALAHVGKLVEAAGRYIEVSNLDPGEGDTKVQKRSQVEAAAELTALNERIPSVTVHLRGAAPADVKLAIDNESFATALLDVPRPINPGAHVVSAEMGAQHVDIPVQILESQHQDVLLTLEPGQVPPSTLRASASRSPVAPIPPSPSHDEHAPPSPSHDERAPPAAPTPPLAPSTPLPNGSPPSTWSAGHTAAIALGIVGMGAVGVGVWQGIRYDQEYRRAQRLCPMTCPEPNHTTAFVALSNASQAGTLAVVAGAIGGASLLGGAILWLTAGSPSSASHPAGSWDLVIGRQAAAVELRGAW